MKAIDHTAVQFEDAEQLSITDVARKVREESEGIDPLLREHQLDGMIQICDLMSRTGLIRIPAIIYGGILNERDRVSVLANEKADKADFGGVGGVS